LVAWKAGNLWQYEPFVDDVTGGLVLATVPVLDPAGIIGLRGNGLTPSKIDDFLTKPSL